MYPLKHFFDFMDNNPTNRSSPVMEAFADLRLSVLPSGSVNQNNSGSPLQDHTTRPYLTQHVRHLLTRSVSKSEKPAIQAESIRAVPPHGLH